MARTAHLTNRAKQRAEAVEAMEKANPTPEFVPEKDFTPERLVSKKTPTKKSTPRKVFGSGGE